MKHTDVTKPIIRPITWPILLAHPEVIQLLIKHRHIGEFPRMDEVVDAMGGMRGDFVYKFFKKEPGEIPKHSLYRWHVPDPIRFKDNMKVTIEALGWWPNGKFQPLTDDIASVAYWYQTEPHKQLPALPAREMRFPR